MILRLLILASVSALVASGIQAHAAITYVDATTANTTVNGVTPAAGVNHTVGPADGLHDNLWHLRSGVGNSNSVWSADELNGSSEDVPPLITTITFPEAGAYRLYVYIWNSEEAGADWDVRWRLGSSGVYSKIQSSEAEPASATQFSGSIITEESGRRLIQIPAGVVIVPSGGNAQVYIDDDATIDTRRTWYDGVGYEKAFQALQEPLIAIDFNKTNSPASPVQAMFRSVRGSSSASQNSTNITKQVGSHTVRLSKTSTLGFDFQGANGVTNRVIPGGSTSLSFLVADFIGARDGTINIGISNLVSGTYLFRSYHLDTLNASNLGYAQGNASTNRNTLRAHVGGVLQAIIQPTALGPAGLGTNFISDADIPTLSFPFEADGTNSVTINLSTVYTNGTDRFILLNGFEIFSTIP